MQAKSQHPITFADQHAPNTLLARLISRTHHDINGEDCAPADMIFASILTTDVDDAIKAANTDFLQDLRTCYQLSEIDEHYHKQRKKYLVLNRLFPNKIPNTHTATDPTPQPTPPQALQQNT